MEFFVSNLPKIVNSIGLIFDIIGAILLWKYGLPEPISKTGAVYIIAEQTDEVEKELANRYDQYANAGIGLLILGFVLQLISNLIPSAR